MSSGEGDLHAKCDMYRRQLGAANARERRLRAEARELESRLREVHAMCCEWQRKGVPPLKVTVDLLGDWLRERGILGKEG